MTQPLYVSLARYTAQEIQPNKYTLLEFPDTSKDASGLGKMAGEDRRLIYPATSGIACLEMNVIWEAPSAAYPVTKFRYVFSRNPLGLDNRTGYNHVAPVKGTNCFTSTHWISVDLTKFTSLGVWVQQDSAAPLNVTHAQFKLVLFPTGG